MKLVFLFILAFSNAFGASLENSDVVLLPHKKVLFTTLSPISFSANPDEDTWIQSGRVLRAKDVAFGHPGCSVRRASKLDGKVLKKGLLFPMPKSVDVRGPMTFRTIPVSKELGLALDCATNVGRGWNGLPFLDSDTRIEYGKLSIAQLRSILKDVISLTITP